MIAIFMSWILSKRIEYASFVFWIVLMKDILTYTYSNLFLTYLGWHSQCWQIQNTNLSPSSLSPPFFFQNTIVTNTKYKFTACSTTRNPPHHLPYNILMLEISQNRSCNKISYRRRQQGNFKATSPIFVMTTVKGRRGCQGQGYWDNRQERSDVSWVDVVGQCRNSEVGW